MERTKAVCFTAEEQAMIISAFEDFKDVITAKSNTVAAAKARENAWQKIADRVNACNPNGPRRSCQQIKTKYKNIIQSANRKKNEKRKTGGGPPPPDYTVAEELVLSNNQGRPLMEGIAGGTSSDPGGSSISKPLVEVEGHTIKLLNPGSITHEDAVAAAADDHDEDTISVCSERPSENIQYTEQTSSQPGPSTYRRGRVTSEAGTDTVRALYKRTLELDIQYKLLQIKKIKLEIEQLEYEKMKLQHP